MKLSAFTLLLFFVSVALAIASLVGRFQEVQYLTEYQYWLMTGAFGVLAFGLIFKGQSH
ncbi:hypothetical protein [Asticcacaulis sp. AC402]|uniref:hypothetical protein n=1 Tax=Asticcacaulis sp. AC402 TaxID=1282361 RepID=UPI0003C3AD80|nr:hypothetical protein [Asticcacaulis sp. AC402]ESQ76850.1 hypothetical protein ABAC402_04085 [Asticcacaulis sp. AC402]